MDDAPQLSDAPLLRPSASGNGDTEPEDQEVLDQEVMNQ
jgi:hypothetical protein